MATISILIPYGPSYIYMLLLLVIVQRSAFELESK